MLSTTKLHNHAHFDVSEEKSEAESEIQVLNGEIGMLHGVVDKIGAEFDIVLLDKVGREHLRHHIKAGNERFGERINLPLRDSYFTMRVENVHGAKAIDVFVE